MSSHEQAKNLFSSFHRLNVHRLDFRREKLGLMKSDPGNFFIKSQLGSFFVSPFIPEGRLNIQGSQVPDQTRGLPDHELNGRPQRESKH
jgi:hypothetical protein